MAEKIPYTQTIPAVSDGKAVFYVRDNRVNMGTWLFLQHIGARNRNADGTVTKIRVGRGRDQVITHLFEEEAGPTPDVFYHTEKTYFVPEGERLIAEFYGTGAGDMLEVHADGYTTPKVESGKAAVGERLEAPSEG